MVKSRYIGDGHPTFNRNPYNGYIIINHYYWVDDHPLLYGNNGSLDPGTYLDTLVSNVLVPEVFSETRAMIVDQDTTKKTPSFHEQERKHFKTTNDLLPSTHNTTLLKVGMWNLFI